jgi:tetratricopeptide (TPR) repeat protein
VHINPVQETLTLAARVVVGYDDAKEVVVIHDPTFGPAWEVGYDDLELMWGAADHAWTIAYSESSTVGRDAGEPTSRMRTPDELAVEHYVLGYALSSQGDLTRGEKQFREGLDIAETSVGMKYLLLLDLALNLTDQKQFDEAVSVAEKASELLPESAAPESLLAEIYPLSSVPEAVRKAKEAEEVAEELAKDSRAQEKVATVLPCNLWMRQVSAIRGWCGP